MTGEGGPSELHRTIAWNDLREPSVSRVARQLRRFLVRLRLRGVPVAVNGVLKKRWYLRRHKLWEYARGLAYSQPQPEHKILDFGGGATLPVFFLAAGGADVKCLDIDRRLAEHTNAVAHREGWRLEATSTDVTSAGFPPDWPSFDRVFSFCVLEHLPKPKQQRALALLAEALVPGGELVMTFDFGPDAPEEGAVRDVEEVEGLVEASGLELKGGGAFRDTGERFALDRRHPDRRFTFGSVFLERPR